MVRNTKESFLQGILNHKDIHSNDGLFIKCPDVPPLEDSDLAQLILKGISVVVYKKENADAYLNFKKVSGEYEKFSDIPGTELDKYNMSFKQLQNENEDAPVKIYANVLPVLFVYLMDEDQSIVDIYNKRFKLIDIKNDIEDNIPINVTDEEVQPHPIYGMRLWTVLGNYGFLPKRAT